jgi:glycerate kinase
MKMIFAPDSFKGSLSSIQVIELLKEAAYKVFPDIEIIGVPIADGGEGTKEALVSFLNGKYKHIKVKNTLGEEISASYGVLDKESVIIEMASASGLTLISNEKRNPLYTTTYGTGEMIKDALENGFTNITIAIGGSGTNDGGIGAMSALGVKFLDKSGKEVKPIGQSLIDIVDIDISEIHPQIHKADFTVMCDVTNHLLGPEGATYVYGPQKGGNKEELDYLESGMRNYAKVIEDKFHIDITNIAGAGAAGGLGAALMVFANAKLKSGISTVLEKIHFEDFLEGASCVLTGEGMLDWQSASGKVVAGIGLLCKKKGIPVIAIVGGMGEGALDIYQYGIDSIVPAINAAMDMEEAMERAEELLLNAAERTFRLIKVGMMMK